MYTRCIYILLWVQCIYTQNIDCGVGFIKWDANVQHQQYNLKRNETCTCPVGMYRNNEFSCKLCPVNMYKNTTHPLDICNACDSGETTLGASGASMCHKCTEHTEFIDSTGSCYPCPLEWYTLIKIYDAGIISWIRPHSDDVYGVMDQGNTVDLAAKFTIICPSIGGYVTDFIQSVTLCPPGSESIKTGATNECVKCEHGKYKLNVDTLQETYRCIERSICSGDTYENVSVETSTYTDSVCLLDSVLYSQWCYATMSLGSDAVSVNTHRTGRFSACRKCNQVQEMHGPIDVMKQKWELGEFFVYASDIAIDCIYKCPDGTYPLETENGNSKIITCVGCVAGQYMHGHSCKTCEAGYYSLENSTICSECVKGKYSQQGSSVCTDCCLVETTYESDNDNCDPTTHYLTGSCDAGRGVPNVVECSALAVSKQKWNVYGDSHCDPVCDSGSYYNRTQAACLNCPVHEQSSQWDVAAICKPICASGFFLSKQQNATDIALQYTCKQCSNSLDYMKLKCFPDTQNNSYYIDINTCGGLPETSDTKCKMCAVHRNIYQTQIQPLPHLADVERCQFMCMPSDVTNQLYYVPMNGAADILHIQVEDLKLRIEEMNLDIKLNTSQSHCIRSTILSWESCIHGYPIISAMSTVNSEFPWTVDVKNTFDVWPTIKCIQNNKCSIIGGMYDTTAQTTEPTCHCHESYYGTYDTNTNILQECHSCPMGTTSLPATNGKNGCFCDRGFTRISNDTESMWRCRYLYFLYMCIYMPVC